MEHYLTTHGRVTESLFDTTLAPREAIELTLRRSAKMQCEAGHPKGCLVSLGLMSACSEESTVISAPLTRARSLNRAAMVACIERAIAAGDLSETAIPEAIATVFDSFLLGLSTLARDGLPHAKLDAAVTQIMGVWDSQRIVSEGAD